MKTKSLSCAVNRHEVCRNAICECGCHAWRSCADCGDFFPPRNEHQRRCNHCQVIDDGYDL